MKTQVIFELTAAISLAGIVVSAQKPAPAAFDVASIRSASLPTPDTVRSGQFRAGSKINGGRVDFAFVSLAELLPYAYRVKAFQVSGPASIRESRWNILATMPEGASEDQVPEMMQTLLAERFKLKVHHEKREQSVYELVVVKGGPKMEAAEAGDESTNAGPSLPGLFPGLPPGGPAGPDGRGRGPDGRGGRGLFIAGGQVGDARISPGANCALRLEFDKLSMRALADTLTPFLDRPVIDQTDVKGNFKAAMNLPMEAMFAMMQNMARTSGFPMPGPGGQGWRGPGGGPVDGPAGGRGPGGCEGPGAFANGGDSSNAAIFQAVQQLGLKLQPRKMPFDTIVVDNVEKTPSEN
jgi:uncharacterized protein (TIGR03435 family)